MFIIFLVSLMGGEANTLEANHRDIQQVAIETITGTSSQAVAPRPASTMEHVRIDPQTEIVNRITGRNVEYPARPNHSPAVSDLQPAIARAISGGK